MRLDEVLRVMMWLDHEDFDLFLLKKHVPAHREALSRIVLDSNELPNLRANCLKWLVSTSESLHYLIAMLDLALTLGKDIIKIGALYGLEYVSWDIIEIQDYFVRDKVHEYVLDYCEKFVEKPGDRFCNFLHYDYENPEWLLEFSKYEAEYGRS